MIRWEVLPFRGANGIQGTCRVLADPARSVVIMAEMEGNPGPSVTNAAEQIATQVCQRYTITPTKLLLIEHYPQGLDGREEESFDLVRFGQITALFFRQPAWQPASRRWAEEVLGVPIP